MDFALLRIDYFQTIVINPCNVFYRDRYEPKVRAYSFPVRTRRIACDAYFLLALALSKYIFDVGPYFFRPGVRNGRWAGAQHHSSRLKLRVRAHTRARGYAGWSFVSPRAISLVFRTHAHRYTRRDGRACTYTRGAGPFGFEVGQRGPRATHVRCIIISASLCCYAIRVR